MSRRFTAAFTLSASLMAMPAYAEDPRAPLGDDPGGEATRLSRPPSGEPIRLSP